jgi:PqqD family protein of HPr-rel-A system
VTTHERAAEEIDETFVPRLRSHIASVVVDDEAVIYDEESGSVHLLNPSASILWQCFDGSSTLAELISDVCEAFQIDDAAARRDVMEVARSIGGLGLLEGIARSPEETAKEQQLGHHDHDHV